MIKRLKAIIWVMLFVSFTAYANDRVNFELIVPEKVYSDQEFVIIFRLENANGQDFRAPEFRGCQVVEGPKVSYPSRYIMEWGIGRSLNCTDYAYVLKTDRKKKIKIGSATVRVNGKLLKTKAEILQLSSSTVSSYSDELVSFKVVVPEKVEVGKNFKAVFVLKNARGENFDFPTIKNCELIYGPEESRRGGFPFFGQTSVETTYTLVLRAQKTGKIKFPSASIMVNGKTLKTKKLKIKILPESKKTREKRFYEAQRRYQSI